MAPSESAMGLKQRSLRAFPSLAVADFCAFRVHLLFLDGVYTDRQGRMGQPGFIASIHRPLRSLFD